MLKNKFDLLFIGGHHSSALPLALMFKEQGYSIVFVGHKYNSASNKFVSSEYKEVTSYDIPHIHLKAAKFYNVPGIKKYLVFIKSVFLSFGILLKTRPKVVVSYGGYLSVPLVLSAKILGIKSVTHEQTAVSGMANRVVTKLADLVFLTWESSLSHFPNKKAVIVGLPLRKEILNIKPRTLGPKYALKTVFIQGGKQGSHVLNEFIFNNLDFLAKKFKIYHSTGRNSLFDDYSLSQKLKKKYPNYFPFDYKFGADYMDILSKADFLISRSGAHTVYEVSYLKIPAIFVPIPWASNQEQKHNALTAQEYVPSVLLEQDNLNLKSFKNAFEELKKLVKRKVSYKQVPLNATQKMFDIIKNKYL